MLPERIITRALQLYWRSTRAVTLGAQGIVLDPQGRVLLVRHGYRPGWHFPGGGVEKSEAIATALARELDEETGVKLGAEPQLFGVYTNFRAFPGDHIALFVIRDWHQPQVPPPRYEILEQGFFARDALPEGTVEPARRRLAEVLDSAPRAQSW